MTRTDRDALIERYLTQYAEILFHLLNKEDPSHPDVNYYHRLCRFTRIFYAQQGRWLTEEETLAIIHEACRKLAQHLLLEGYTFDTIRPKELSDALMRIMKE